MTPPFRNPVFFGVAAFVITAIFQALVYMHPDANVPLFLIVIGPFFMSAVAYAVSTFVLDERNDPPGHDSQDLDT
ncbi:MAG: hypothetical protein Q4P66_05975 [Actinomycetaceae bacterium]|nr:hypothetical protein [Actinomycetaceae bacterium]